MRLSRVLPLAASWSGGVGGQIAEAVFQVDPHAAPSRTRGTAPPSRVPGDPAAAFTVTVIAPRWAKSCVMARRRRTALADSRSTDERRLRIPLFGLTVVLGGSSDGEAGRRRA
jgi:hypothetical protein